MYIDEGTNKLKKKKSIISFNCAMRDLNKTPVCNVDDNEWAKI